MKTGKRNSSKDCSSPTSRYVTLQYYIFNRLIANYKPSKIIKLQENYRKALLDKYFKSSTQSSKFNLP